MKKTYLATALAALFATPITSVIAADTLLDDVVVSSSRSEQRSFDAPAAIQSLEKEVIQGSGPKVNLSESLNRVPGLVVLNRQNYAQDLQISIRGFGARSQFGVRGIQIITDGIPATIADGQSQPSTVSLTSTDRVEVLRGPMAQLYGNSAGGVIQTFTRDAPEIPELLVQGYLGSYGLQRTDIQFAEKLNKFGIVADYSTFKIDGYRNNSKAERTQFNGKFTYSHNQNTSLTLIANVFDMPYGYDPSGLDYAKAQSDPQASRNLYLYPGYAARKVVKQSQTGFILDHKFDAYSKVSFKLYDGNRENTQYTAKTSASVTPKWNSLDRDYSGLAVDYSSKIDVNGKALYWSGGLSYDKSDEIYQSGDESTSGASIGEKATTAVNQNRKTSNFGLFAQGSYFIAEKFSATLGARSVDVKIKSQDATGTLGNPSFKSINPVAGITYHAQNNLNIYANYGKGFETPTLSELTYTTKNTNDGLNTSFNRNLMASKSDHYEIGMKWLPSTVTRFDLATYYIRTQNEIVVDYNQGVNNSFTNVPGGTTRLGWELSAITYLYESLKATSSLSQIRATFNDRFTEQNNTIPIASGNTIPGVPNGLMFNELVWSEKKFYKNKYKQIMGTMVGGEWVTAGHIYADDKNSLRSPGYSVFNLKITHRIDVDKFTVTTYGHINNLTDKRYIGSVIVGNSTPFEPAPGRNWMLGLNATARF